jgi:hypothetical protein
MNHDSTIFEFETDFAGALYCIPMAVRRKLDLCGVKVSLKQWNRFTLEQREHLVARECDTNDEIDAYGREVARLLEARAGDTPQFLDRDAGTEWKDTTGVPQRLIAYCEERGVAAPSLAQWASLTELQRFALFKLTRPGHTNENFIPAMREFGLIA